MATERQIEANRANARRSTGPRTEAGKARSRMNALRHGLRAETVVLAHEDRAAFEELHADLRADLAPAGALEALLVEQIAAGAWRMRRAWQTERELIERDLIRSLRNDRDYPNSVILGTDTPTTLGKIFAQDLANEQRLGKLARYAAQIERAWFRAVRELRLLRKDPLGEGVPLDDDAEDAGAEGPAAPPAGAEAAGAPNEPNPRPPAPAPTPPDGRDEVRDGSPPCAAERSAPNEADSRPPARPGPHPWYAAWAGHWHHKDSETTEWRVPGRP